jgi:hypothetical protein
MWLFVVVVMYMWFELMLLFVVVVMHMWFELMLLFVVVVLVWMWFLLTWMSLFVAHSRSLLSTIQQEPRLP